MLFKINLNNYFVNFLLFKRKKIFYLIILIIYLLYLFIIFNNK